MKRIYKILFFFGLLLLTQCALAQDENLPFGSGRINKGQTGRGNTAMPLPGMGGNPSGNQGDANSDSLQFEHRDNSKDAAAVFYRLPDSTLRHSLDSSINDFDKYFLVSSHDQYLGNNGAAVFSLIFQPPNKSGWDPGFHAYDPYAFNIANTKFYTASKPFTSISYELASGKEQMIHVLHTQHPGRRFNIGLEYRLVNAPGLFLTQNTNHNNYRFYTNYNSNNKRYHADFIFLANSLSASENGGVTNDSFLLDINRKKRFSVPVMLGGATFNPNPFTTTVYTGNIYKQTIFDFKHGFDLGSKDSIVLNDSVTEKLFYARWRIQHEFRYGKYDYTFRDNYADSTVYSDWYGQRFQNTSDTFLLHDQWLSYSNEFSIIQFPEKKNNAHFIKAGINYSSFVGNDSIHLHDAQLKGEYRFPSRNRTWDVQLKGAYSFSGDYSGNHAFSGSLARKISKKHNRYFSGFFENTNRTPAFVFDTRSGFHLDTANVFKKENITSMGAAFQFGAWSLGFKNHLLLNHVYYTDKYHAVQYDKAINLLQLYLSDKIRLGRHWNWYLETTFQKTEKDGPVRVPLFFGRSRLAYEGLFFKNLNLSTGIELRYFSKYKAPGYSPAIGQFYVQDSVSINNLPDVAAFLHFRIRSFTGFLRAENLNTIDLQNGLSFIHNNFTAPHYPSPGLMIRFGIKWFFVN